MTSCVRIRTDDLDCRVFSVCVKCYYSHKCTIHKLRTWFGLSAKVVSEALLPTQFVRARVCVLYLYIYKYNTAAITDPKSIGPRRDRE